VELNCLLVHNGRVITPLEVINEGEVLIENGLIKDVGKKGTLRCTSDVRKIDAAGAYVSPGFIDLHVHGGGGGDAMSGSTDELRAMARTHAAGGTTALLATTCTGDLEQIHDALDAIDTVIGEADTTGARIIGAHVEGPYFSYEQRGAQNPAQLRNPRRDEYLKLIDKHPSVMRVSAAPELPGALELGRELLGRGIVASIAHSSATYRQVLEAVSAGYSHVTHIYSGMSRFERVNSYRVSGVLEAALLLDELTTEMIADGHHLPPSLMKLVLKTKGLNRVCLVTDAMSAAGLGPGNYSLGGMDVVVEGDIPECFEVLSQPDNFVAKLTDRTAFAGSVATMDRLVRNMVFLVGLSIQDAVKMATINPARMQGLHKRMGICAPGMLGDLVVFDNEINIQMTIVNGKVVFNCKAEEVC
jgi:N-acetylglucosamine-6-phosphate deacetylase